jgi:hypothetical protein
LSPSGEVDVVSSDAKRRLGLARPSCDDTFGRGST